MLKIKEFRAKHPIRFNIAIYFAISLIVFSVIGAIFGRPWYEGILVALGVTIVTSFDSVLKELDKQSKDGTL